MPKLTEPVTNRELAAMQRADHDVLITLKTTLDLWIAEARQNRSMDTTTIADHEARLRALENKNEVDKGTLRNAANTRRTAIEIITVIALVVTAYATYLLGKSH